jgi:hypothetical protein
MTRYCLACALALCFGLPVRAADKPQADVLARPAVALLHVTQDKNDRSDYRAFRNTQAVLLKSRLVLNGALRKPGIAELDVGQGAKRPRRLACG